MGRFDIDDMDRSFGKRQVVNCASVFSLTGFIASILAIGQSFVFGYALASRKIQGMSPSRLKRVGYIGGGIFFLIDLVLSFSPQHYIDFLPSILSWLFATTMFVLGYGSFLLWHVGLRRELGLRIWRSGPST